MVELNTLVKEASKYPTLQRLRCAYIHKESKGQKFQIVLNGGEIDTWLQIALPCLIKYKHIEAALL